MLDQYEGGPTPAGRDSHAATCLGQGEDHPQLLISGGLDGSNKTLKDSWLLDLQSGRWTEVRVRVRGMHRKGL